MSDQFGGTIVVDRDGTHNVPKKVNGHARPEVMQYWLNANRQRRAQMGYDALRDSTEFEKTWANADFLAADALNSKANRHKAMKYSRYECESNAYYDGILSSECNLLTGTGPQLRVLGRNREFNQLVEREFYRWAQEVDLYRKLWCMTHARVQDGEAFAVMVDNPELRNRVKLDLVLIEAEQVQTPYIPFGEERGYTDGIRFDPDNPHNILWYDVLREHPGGTSILNQEKPIRVNPRDMLHWFKPRRPGQHRGMPALLSALNVSVSARRMKEATLAAAETAADLNVVATTQQSPDSIIDPMAPFSTVPIQKRMLTVSPMGWDLKHFQSEQPNAQYEDFMRSLHAELGRPIHHPVNLVEGDSSDYSFASGKLDMLVKFLSLDVERQDCNIAVLDRVFAAWFRLWTILTERRDVPPPHQWDWPAHPIIDAESDARAKDTQLKNGALSLREYHSKAGRDYEDELQVQAEDAFGTTESEADREQAIAAMRKINVLRNTPAPAMQYVAQLLGLATEPSGQSETDIALAATAQQLQALGARLQQLESNARA